MGTVKQSVYLTIVNDYKRKIELGILAANERLPSCRELGLKLGVNPNTVQRAYSTLEEDGYIFTLPKKGVYVSRRKEKSNPDGIAKEKLTELKKAGFTREKLIELINGIYGGDND